MGIEFVNCGINGDTTGGMLTRLQDEMTAHSPDKVLLMGGGNDIFISGTAAGRATDICEVAGSLLPLLPLRLPPFDGNRRFKPYDYYQTAQLYPKVKTQASKKTTHSEVTPS
jgi:lysophospholipase L1-like esterase